MNIKRKINKIISKSIYNLSLELVTFLIKYKDKLKEIILIDFFVFMKIKIS